MLNIIDKRKYTYIASALLVAVSLFALLSWGLRFGIDFTGGTLMEIQSTQNITKEAIIDIMAPTGSESLVVQTSEDNRALVRYRGSDETQNQKVLAALQSLDGDMKQLRVDFIGATISSQLRDSAAQALTLAIIGILLYIAWAFRKVAFPVSSWIYGFGAIAALFHDIIITLGAFAFLGRFAEAEVGVPFIAALLTILGYSVNDTIVIYDRVRENILRHRDTEDFEKIVNTSVNQSLARSINTSATVLVVLAAIILFGGSALTWFALALFIGVMFGTYSSIFVASALLVSVYQYRKKKTQK